MIGAIIGDIIGSRFEGSLFQREPTNLRNDTCEFTDDTVLTCAVAQGLLRGTPPELAYREWWKKYPGRSYGSVFTEWAQDTTALPTPYRCNKAAMRVSPIALLAQSKEEAIRLSVEYSKPTHTSEEALKGAEAIAVLTWFAKRDPDPSFVQTVCKTDYYPLDLTMSDYEQAQIFEASCSDTVPKAVIAATTASSFEEAMINAIKTGGDINTIASMTGGIAEGLFGIPESLGNWGWEHLGDEMQDLMKVLYRKAGYEVCFDGTERKDPLLKPSLIEKLLRTFKNKL